MKRLVCLVLCLWPTVAFADDPSWCHDGYLCIEDERARIVRDKARGFELICSQTDDLSLPPALGALCEAPSGASRIWAKAQKTTLAQQKARKAQREANQAAATAAERKRLLDQQRARNRQLEARPSGLFWVGLGGCLAATAAGGIQLALADSPKQIIQGGTTIGVGLLLGCGGGLLAR